VTVWEPEKRVWLASVSPEMSTVVLVWQHRRCVIRQPWGRCPTRIVVSPNGA
jgi:hypothetical protein